MRGLWAICLRLLTLVLSLSLLSATFAPFAAAASSSSAALTPEVSAADMGQAGLGASITSIQGTSNTTVASFTLTLTPSSPQAAQILNSTCNALFTCTEQTDSATGAITVTGSGTGLAAPSELVFFSVTITAPVSQVVPMTLTFQTLKDSSGAEIGLPAPTSVDLQRGAVLNNAGGSLSTARSLTQADVTGALGFLSGQIPAGTGVGQVNPVNLASLLPVGSVLPNVPGPADVVSLLQYLAGQRDQNLVASPAQPVAVTATANGNTFNVELSTPVAGLTAKDLTLVDQSGTPVQILGLSSPDGGLSYSGGAYLTPGATYSLGIALPGYDFGTPVSFTAPASPPIAETPSVSAASPSGFILTMSYELMVALPASDLQLRDSSGASVPITSIRTPDFGTTFIVSAALQAGQTYSLSIALPGYDFGSAVAVAVPLTPIADTITLAAEPTGILIYPNPLVPGMTASDVTLRNSQGNLVAVQSVLPTTGGDEGLSYTLTGNLDAGKSYTVGVSMPGYDFGSPVPYVVPMGNVVYVAAQAMGTSGFDLTLTRPVPGLKASEVSLDGGEGPAVTALTTSDGGTTYHVTAALSRGQVYGFRVYAPSLGLNFVSAANFAVPQPVTLELADVHYGGIDVRFSQWMPGPPLTASSFHLTDATGNAVAITSAVTSDQLSYALLAPITPGGTYSLSVTPPTAADTVTPASLTVPVPAVAATAENVSATGFMLHFALPLPGLTQADLTLTDGQGGTVPVQWAASYDGGAYYSVWASLAIGKSYSVTANIGGQSFGSLGPVALPPLPVAWQVQNLTPSGFDVALGWPSPLISASDVMLKDSAGQAVGVSVNANQPIFHVTPTGPLTAGETYSLSLSAPGYDFGSTQSLVAPPLPVTASVTGVTGSGFTLDFSLALPGLTAANLSLPGAGALSVGAAVYGGESYPVTVPGQGLSPGFDQPLTLKMTGVSFQSTPDVYLPPTSVRATVSKIGLSSLLLSLSPAVPGLGASNLTLADQASGQSPSVQTLASADGGASYTLTLAAGSQFAAGRTYTMALNSSSAVFASSVSFVGPQPATLYVTNVTQGGFTVSANPSVTLAPGDVTLSGGGQTIPILAFAAGRVSAQLAGGVNYTLNVQHAGYVFSPVTFYLPVSVSVLSPTPGGFTLRFSAPVQGLTAAEIGLTDAGGAAVNVASATVGDQGYQYDVTAALARGESYTVAPTLSGFAFGSAAVAVPVESVAIAVYGVSSGGFDLRLSPALPGLSQGNLAITGGGVAVSGSLGASADGGATYPVTLSASDQLVPGSGDNVTLSESGYAFSGAWAYLPQTSVTASVYGVTANSFDLSLSPAVPNLPLGDLQVYGSQGSVTPTGLSSQDGGATYSVSATLPPDDYTLYISDPSVSASPQSFTVPPVSVTASAYDPSPVGFTLVLSQALPAGQVLGLNLSNGTGLVNDTQSGVTRYVEILPLSGTTTLTLSLGSYAFTGPAPFGPSDASATTEASYLATSLPDYEVASILSGTGYSPSEIAIALLAAYPGTSDAQLVKLLQEIGQNGATIPAALLAAFPSEKDSQAATLLKGAGNSAQAITAGLISAYGDGDAAVAGILRQAGFGAIDTAGAVYTNFRDSPSALIAALQAAGFPTSDVASALENTVCASGDASCTADDLASGGVSASAAVGELGSVFGITDAPTLARILYGAGYSARGAASALQPLVTDANYGTMALIGAGYGVGAATDAGVQYFGASAADVARAALPFAPDATDDLAVVQSAGFTDLQTLAGALFAAGLPAGDVAAALLAQFPQDAAALGPDLQAAGYSFHDALTAVLRAGGSAAVAASWPSLFATGGALAAPSAAAGNLRTLGCSGGCSAAAAAALLETVYPSAAGSENALAQALVGGGYSGSTALPVLQAWCVSQGGGTQCDQATGDALYAAGVSLVSVARTLRTGLGDGALQLLPILEASGSSAMTIQTLQQAGFGPADVTAAALSLSGQKVDSAAGLLAQAGYSATDVAGAIERATGGSIVTLSGVTAMLAGSYSAPDVAAALKSYFGATPAAAGAALLGRNLPYGVGDVAAALQSTYSLQGADFVPIVQGAGLSPFSVLANASCRLSLLCALKTTFGLSAPATLRALHGAGSLGDGTLVSIATQVLGAYAITTPGAQASALSQAGYSLPEMATFFTVAGLSLTQALSTLRVAGYSAENAASYLKTTYALDDYGTASTLLYAGYSLNDSVIALEAVYQDGSTLYTTLVAAGLATSAHASAALANAGGVDAPLYAAQGMAGYNYDAGEVVAMLQQAFHETDPTALAQTLKGAGFGSESAIGGLRTAAALSAAGAAAVLSQVFATSTGSGQAGAMWAAGYSARDIAVGLGSTDPVYLAGAMLGGGIDPLDVKSGLQQAFGPSGAIDQPALLAAALSRLGQASFNEAEGERLLVAYGYSPAQMAALMFAGGYSLQDVGSAVSSATGSGSNDDATMTALYEASTCTGGTAGLGACAPGAGAFTSADAAEAFVLGTGNSVDFVAVHMAKAGFSLSTIAYVLWDPSGFFHLPVVAPSLGDGYYGEGLGEALGGAGFTPAQVTPILQAAPLSQSADQIAGAYLSAMNTFAPTTQEPLDVGVAESLVTMTGGPKSALQAMADAGYSAIRVGRVLQYWGYDAGEIYVALWQLGYGWDETSNIVQLFPVDPSSWTQESETLFLHSPSSGKFGKLE